MSWRWNHASHASVSSWKCPARLGLQSHPELRCAVDCFTCLGTARASMWLAGVASDESGVAMGALDCPWLLGWRRTGAEHTWRSTAPWWRSHEPRSDLVGSAPVGGARAPMLASHLVWSILATVLCVCRLALLRSCIPRKSSHVIWLEILSAHSKPLPTPSSGSPLGLVFWQRWASLASGYRWRCRDERILKASVEPC